MTYFPNKFLSTKDIAVEILSNITASLSCHEEAILFFCTVLFPECSQQSITRVPCRSACIDVTTSCQDVVASINDAFEDVSPACNLFPDVSAESDGLCILPEGGTSDLRHF